MFIVLYFHDILLLHVITPCDTYEKIKTQGTEALWADTLKESCGYAKVKGFGLFGVSTMLFLL